MQPEAQRSKKGAPRPLAKLLIHHDSWAARWAFLNQMILELRTSFNRVEGSTLSEIKPAGDCRGRRRRHPRQKYACGKINVFFCSSSSSRKIALLLFSESVYIGIRHQKTGWR
jgi:hypothetical protein